MTMDLQSLWPQCKQKARKGKGNNCLFPYKQVPRSPSQQLLLMSHWLPLTARGAGKCSLSIVYIVFQNKSRVRIRRKGKWLLEWQLAISVASASVFDIVKASPSPGVRGLIFIMPKRPGSHCSPSTYLLCDDLNHMT